MAFRHDVAGGDGTIIAPQVQSPNFQHGISGWRLGRDGSLEAHDVIIPEGSGGTVVTFGPAAPSSPNTGDVWYDTSAGLQANVWSGSAWTPYMISAGALAAGGVNPNPYFAGGDTSNWTVRNGAQLAAVAAAGVGFPWAAQITCGAGANDPFIRGVKFPVAPGDPVQVTGWLNVVSGTGAAIGIEWFDASGTFLSLTQYDVAGGWQPAASVGTAPPTATQADLYVQINSANTTGTEVVQATALTVTGKVNGGAITPGTVGVAQLVAGLVVAGIVDATTITGARFVADGTSGEVLCYSGAPAAGNLVLSASPVAGADQYGNAYPAGVRVKSAGGGYVTLGQDNGYVTLVNGSSVAELGTGSGAAWIGDGKASPGGTNVVFAGNKVYAQSPVQTAGSVPAAEGWHNITPDAGWTVSQQPQYRLKPDGDVELRGVVTKASFTAVQAVNSANPLPAAYLPAANRFYRGSWLQAGAIGGGVYIDPAGVLHVVADTTYPATQAILDGSYTL